MRKCITALIMILMLFTILSACNDEKEIRSVEVDLDTVGEFYIQDSDIDVSHIKLNILFTDGSTESISLTQDMTDGFDISSTGDKTVNVTYRGKSTDFTIKVVPERIIVSYSAGMHGKITGGDLTQTIAYGEDAESVTAMPDTGYKFIGWTDGVKSARRMDTGVTSSFSVTAYFEPVLYNVRFYNRNGDLIGTDAVMYGKAATPPEYDLNVTGFEFTGWVKLSNNQQVNIKNITSDIDLIASYRPANVEVSFYNADDTLISVRTVEYGGSAAPPVPPDRYGWNFTGKWKIRNSGADAVFTNIKENLAVVPVYERAKFTVAFDTGCEVTVAPIQVTYEDAPVNLPEPSRQDKAFNGWYTEPEGGEVFDENSVVTGNITVYAHWGDRYYQVRFFIIKGGSAQITQQVLYGKTASNPGEPEREGHRFQWWETVDGAVYNFNNPVKGDLNIYARWDPYKYRVDFFSNGGSQVPYMTVPHGERITEPVPEPPRGYQYDGWSYKGSKFNFNTPVTEDMSLYAVWKEEIITVTAAYEGNGALNKSGEIEIGYFSSVEITITPAEGYRIKEMYVNDQPVVISDSFILNKDFNSLYVVFAKQSYNITVTVMTAGGVVEDDKGNVIQSGSDFISDVEHGDSVTYTFKPEESHNVYQVRVDNIIVQFANNQYTFGGVDSNHTIRVIFSIKRIPVTVTSNQGGAVTPKGTSNVDYGGDFSFTVNPSANYRIESVTINGVIQEITGDPSLLKTFYINGIRENQRVEVRFIGKSFYVTSISGANGAISPEVTDQEVFFGANIVFNMIPDEGYVVKEIYVNGVPVGKALEYSFTSDIVDSSNTISVEFEEAVYNAEVSKVGNGSVVIDGNLPVMHGEIRVFTITPDAFNHLTSARITAKGQMYNLVAGESNDWYSFGLVDNVYTLTVVFKADIALNVIFELNTYTVNLTCSEHGKIIVNNDLSVTSSIQLPVTYGANMKLTILPDVGYHISSIIKNGETLSGYNQSIYDLTLSNISSDQTISAEYEINKYRISIEWEGPGAVLYEGNPVEEFYADYGARPALTLEPDTGYHVEEFKVNTSDTTVPQELIYILNPVNNDVSVSVKFSIDMFNIQSRQTSNGEVSWSEGYDSIRVGDYDYLKVPFGDSVIYTFTPDAYYHIDYIRVYITPGNVIELYDGYCDDKFEYYVTDKIGTLILNDVRENRFIAAAFKIDSFTVESVVSEGGVVDPSGVKTINYNGNITFTYSALAGYALQAIYVDGEAIDIALYGTCYTFMNIDRNHKIEIYYELI